MKSGVVWAIWSKSADGISKKYTLRNFYASFARIVKTCDYCQISLHQPSCIDAGVDSLKMDFWYQFEGVITYFGENDQ